MRSFNFFAISTEIGSNFLRMRVCTTYKYPSVRLIIPEGMTSAGKIYQIGLFALKSIDWHYLEFSTYSQNTQHVWNQNSIFKLKGHSHAILVNFKNQKYVLTSMNTHK